MEILTIKEGVLTHREKEYQLSSIVKVDDNSFEMWHSENSGAINFLINETEINGNIYKTFDEIKEIYDTI